MSAFTAALFTTTKRQKQPKRSSEEKWRNKMWYTQYKGILFTQKKGCGSDTCYNIQQTLKILSSDRRQIQKNKHCMKATIQNI